MNISWPLFLYYIVYRSFYVVFNGVNITEMKLSITLLYIISDAPKYEFIWTENSDVIDSFISKILKYKSWILASWHKRSWTERFTPHAYLCSTTNLFHIKTTIRVIHILHSLNKRLNKKLSYFCQLNNSFKALHLLSTNHHLS